VYQGASSYQNSLKIEVTVEGSFMDAVSFSASTTYKKVEQESNSHRTVFVDSYALCLQYKAYFTSRLKVKISQSIKNFQPILLKNNITVWKLKLFLETAKYIKTLLKQPNDLARKQQK